LDLWPETIAVIESKFRRSLKAHEEDHGKDLKDLFKRLGIPVNDGTIVAYLLGVLRAIAYDSKVFVQSEGLRWKEEFEKIADAMIGDIMRTARSIASKN